MFSNLLQLPGKVMTFQSGGDCPFPFYFTLEHLLEKIDKNFTIYHVDKFSKRPPHKMGVGHIMERHLPESAALKSTFDLPTIVELFNPKARTHLGELRFGPGTFQWQSSVTKTHRVGM
jgi:hypothetical protein